MTALSAKARAFSVDYLLNSEDSHSSRETESQSPPEEESVCLSMGDGPVCCHNSVHTIAGAEEQSNVRVELCQSELWDAFHALGTEMIITKTGRRMFPALRVRVSGLKKLAKYRLYLDFIPVDRNKYRYVYHSSKWMVSGTGETLVPDQLYLHPDSPMDGSFITSQVISFERVKLTNHNKPKHGQISLISMQKYQPRIHVEEIKEGSNSIVHKHVTSFPQTAFIAVTAYQNQEVRRHKLNLREYGPAYWGLKKQIDCLCLQITRLKIARNPFAKGFREAGKCRSSLEAMMASFGVVIDSNEPPSPKKRRILPADNNEDTGLVTKPTINGSEYQDFSKYTNYSVPTFGQYSSVPIQAFRPITPPKAHSHPVSTVPFSSYPVNPFLPIVLSPSSTPLLTTSFSSQVTQGHNVQLPPNIHPAFRQPSAFTQLTYSDPKWALYNPLTSIMCLQPAKFVSSPYSAITTETKGSDNDADDSDTGEEEDTEDIEVVV